MAVRIDKQGAHRGAYEKNKRIIFKTQNTCGICGRPVDFSLKYPDPMSATIDHIIPINGPGGLQGHPSDLSNLQLSHFSCNRLKSNKIFKEREVFEPVVLGNRNLPQSLSWAEYKASD